MGAKEAEGENYGFPEIVGLATGRRRFEVDPIRSWQIDTTNNKQTGE